MQARSKSQSTDPQQLPVVGFDLLPDAVLALTCAFHPAQRVDEASVRVRNAVRPQGRRTLVPRDGTSAQTARLLLLRRPGPLVSDPQPTR